MDSLDELFQTHGPVTELQFDVAFADHMVERGLYAKHEVSIEEILEVHGGSPRYFENQGLGNASVIMVGATTAGRWLCVPIEPGAETNLWRVRTAFEANAHHRRRYEGETT